MNKLLLKNGFIPNCLLDSKKSENVASSESILTIINNMSYYGFIPSQPVFEKIKCFSEKELSSFWSVLDTELSNITCDSLNISDYVVYANFPEEVLKMDQLTYWLKQVFIYLGVPYDSISEEKQDRDVLTEIKRLRVLDIENEETISNIFNSLVKKTSVWSIEEYENVLSIVSENSLFKNLTLSDFGFKLNGISFSKCLLKEEVFNFGLNDATDVMRFVSLLVNEQADLRKVKTFKSIPRSLRKTALIMLENSKNFENDISFNTSLWKKLLCALHPSESNNFPRCYSVLDSLCKNTYKKTVETQIASILQSLKPKAHKKAVVIFPDKNAQLSTVVKKYKGKEIPHDLIPDSPFAIALTNHVLYEKVKNKKNNAFLNTSVDTEDLDASVIKLHSLYAQRPNLAIKNFQNLYSIFGQKAIGFLEVAVDSQTVYQLLKFKNYLKNIVEDNTRIATPRGDWSKMRVFSNSIYFDELTLKKAFSLIDSSISKKMNSYLPNGVILDEKCKDIKLPHNGQELATFGSGTKFDIPSNINFIRTNIYWDVSHKHHVWFDNGFSFFDNKWKSLGACCWNSTNSDYGACFSGDPTSANNDGYAVQFIDLDINKLLENGIRYAVWSALAFNNIPFSDPMVNNVFAAMQLCENPQAGELFEPSRANLSFNLKGDTKNKYIAFVDLVERKVIYLDLTLYSKVNSAKSNLKTLEKYMPALCEFNNRQPSVYDLFSCVKKGKKTDPKVVNVLYSDKNVLVPSRDAYVFKRENEKNSFNNLNIFDYLSKI